MKRILFLLVFLHGIALSQGAPPLTVQESDGSPKKAGVSRIVVSNGTLTITGTTATINTSGSGSGLADPGANGVVIRTAAGTTIARTLTGTAAEITITNGTGVSANPTFSLPSALTFTGKTITGGTFSGATFSTATLTVPTIADFTNATHNHSNAAGGGQLSASNVFSAGTVPVARLPVMVGDSGSGGTAGLVPAPATGDATKFLKGDGTWATPSGGGGSPGGSDTQLQYNNASAFGGISGATSDGTNVTFGSANLRATSPRITTGILDSSGNAIINLTATGSANRITVANAGSGAGPVISATGSDTDISLTLSPKGAGVATFTKQLLLNAGTGFLDNTIFIGGTTSGAVDASFGFLVGGVGSSDASAGPYFFARGNNFTGSSDQKGEMIFTAGNITSPTGNQGTIRFFTGSETERMQITPNGTIQLFPINFSALGTPSSGNFIFCGDCAVTSGSDNTCTSGGSGAFAFRVNSAWRCFALQN